MAEDLVARTINSALDAIAKRTFRPGQSLPAEAELAKLFEVSRATMREAVRSLAVGGVLSVIQGKGTFVRPLGTWSNTAYITHVSLQRESRSRVDREIGELRWIIEVKSAQLAAQRRTEEELDQLKIHMEGYEQAHRNEQVQQAVVADLAFHRVIMDSTHNIYLASTLTPLGEALVSSRFRAAEDSRYREQVIGHHQRIYEAIAAGDGDLAEAAMDEHIASSPNLDMCLSADLLR